MAANEDRGSTISGCWHNQLGTRMEITASEDGSVTGRIHSEVGGVGGEQPVVGYVAPALGRRGVIGLVVRWKETHSVTTWSGHYDLEGNVIVANWLLTAADFDQNEWQSTRVGHDVFHRVPVRTEGSGAERSLSAGVPPGTR